jgi:uncharacterized membrane protein YkvA (DUF1232 family)
MSPRKSRFLAWIGAAACVVYLLNPTAGYIELIPDNFPIVGNLDEAGVTLLLVKCMQKIRSKDRTPV